MKKLLLSSVAGLALFALATPTLAKDKEVTITGEAKCAKCALHEGNKCQTVIETEAKGKKLTYYVASNDLAKEFHGNVCSGTKKVKAVGTVKKVDDKRELTLTKIDIEK